MRLFIALLLFVIVLPFYKCGGDKGNIKNDGPSGYAVFKKHCVSCHGVDGRMGLNGAKPIPESVLTLEDRIKHITNGKGAMQPYKGVLTTAEIAAVADYSFKVGKEKKEK